MLRIVSLLLIALGFVQPSSLKSRAIYQDSGEPQTLITGSFEGDKFSFLIAGDNGGFPEPFYSTQLQRSVAASMAKQSTEYDCKFILEIGDNFYFRGVKDIYDARWTGTFENVYYQPSLYIPWYITTGNHDWGGSVQAQIDYTQVSTRWTFPWYWYALEHTLEPSGTKLTTIMFETTIPCGVGTNSIDGIPIDDSMAAEEWSWLEKQLQDSQDSDYIIVAGHYPIYSAASVGPSVACLKEKLDPLLQTYGVSAYIAGHEHNVQYLNATDGSKVKYIIVGCSNFISPFFGSKNTDEFDIEFLWASWSDLLTGCFGRVDVGTSHMNITALEGGEGQKLYSVTIPKRIKP